MKLVPALAATAAFAALTACGGGGQGETAAEQLEDAAEQSGPAAAEVLENAADNIEGMEGPAAANAAQAALQRAGNAQAATLPEPQPEAPSLQAQVNRGGQQVPPPRTRADVPAGNSQ